MLFQTCLTDFLLLIALFFILLCLPYIESQWDPMLLMLDPTDLNCTDKNSLQNVIFFCVQENIVNHTGLEIHELNFRYTVRLS